MKTYIEVDIYNNLDSHYLGEMLKEVAMSVPTHSKVKVSLETSIIQDGYWEEEEDEL